MLRNYDLIYGRRSHLGPYCEWYWDISRTVSDSSACTLDSSFVPEGCHLLTMARDVVLFKYRRILV